jgi:hypothetical protein
MQRQTAERLARSIDPTLHRFHRNAAHLPLPALIDQTQASRLVIGKALKYSNVAQWARSIWAYRTSGSLYIDASWDVRFLRRQMKLSHERPEQ